MWRRPDNDDLVATLSQKEIDAFRASAGFAADPIERLLTRTAAMVRGYIRSGGKCALSPNEGEIPESTISKAMDYAAFDVLKRLNLKPNEARTQARTAAEEFFRRIEDGKIIPESYGASEDKPTGGPCAVVIRNARARVDAKRLEGL